MTPLLVVSLFAAVILGIMLKSALRTFFLVGLVLGIFFASCYAFDISPRVVLLTAARTAKHEYKKHRYVEFAWL